MSKARIISVNASSRRRVVFDVTPEIAGPNAGWFGHREQAYLKVLFREPIEYVEHELLAKPSAELLIFGGPAVLVPGLARFFDCGDDAACGLSTLVDGDAPTAAQETLLFQRLNYARMRLVRLVCGYVEGTLGSEQIREMLAWGFRVNAIRDQLARICLSLVPAMAKQGRFQHLDFNELASEGNCALLRAIMTFDCSRGYRFSTYACRAILKSFARVILRTTRYRNHFPVEFDPELQRDDMAEIDRADVHVNCVDELRTMLVSNRAKLTDVEQVVIRERFALATAADENAVPKTLDEIGDMIGVTKERVRQIQNKALAKLRHDMEKNYLAA